MDILEFLHQENGCTISMIDLHRLTGMSATEQLASMVDELRLEGCIRVLNPQAGKYSIKHYLVTFPPENRLA